MKIKSIIVFLCLVLIAPFIALAEEQQNSSGLGKISDFFQSYTNQLDNNTSNTPKLDESSQAGGFFQSYQQELSNDPGTSQEDNSLLGKVGNFFRSYSNKVFNPSTQRDYYGNSDNPEQSVPLPPIPLLGNTSQTASQQTSQQPVRQYVASWTNSLKEKLATRNENPDQITDEIMKQNLLLDKEYEGSANYMLSQYLGEKKGELDELTEKTREKARQENGSEEKPFYIEPNQFRKICDKNEYVLYSRVGGASNRDMRNPLQTGGPATGEQSVWRVPTCDELAACHCCINTCTDIVMRRIGEAIIPICLPNVGFGPMNCSPLCKAPVARGSCRSFSGPSHGDQGNRDCMGRKNGCESAGGCKVIIRDPNYTQFEYTTTPDSQVYVKSKPGDNYVPPGSKVKKLNGANALPQGWIGQLDAAAGQCCKCIQG